MLHTKTEERREEKNVTSIHMAVYDYLLRSCGTAIVSFDDTVFVCINCYFWGSD
jgi:hypothetical protein